MHCANPDCDATFRAVLSALNFIIDSLIPEGDPRRLQGDDQGPPLKVSRPRRVLTDHQPETRLPASPKEAAQPSRAHNEPEETASRYKTTESPPCA